MQRAMPGKLFRLTQNILYDIMVPSDRKLYYSFLGPSSEYRNLWICLHVFVLYILIFTGYIINNIP